MTIKYAILGFLSWRPLAGYDIKKLMIDSPVTYWSGNNNQIYRTLVELHAEGLVTNEVQPQAHLPARKVYTITEQGRAALAAWLRTARPELPQHRNTFLIQLAWADQLTADELDALLAAYEHEVEVQCLVQRERQRRGTPEHPARTRREAYLWDMIAEDYLAAYERELVWVRRVRAGLRDMRDGEVRHA